MLSKINLNDLPFEDTASSKRTISVRTKKESMIVETKQDKFLCCFNKNPCKS